jgi:hypothetical protein
LTASTRPPYDHPVEDGRAGAEHCWATVGLPRSFLVDPVAMRTLAKAERGRWGAERKWADRSSSLITAASSSRRY